MPLSDWFEVLNKIDELLEQQINTYQASLLFVTGASSSNSSPLAEEDRELILLCLALLSHLLAHSYKKEIFCSLEVRLLNLILL
jgi:hypothetical protein